MLAIHRLSSARLALLLAVLLLSLAGAIIYFVHPGGFEGQIVWAFVLLPGFLPAQAVSVITDKASTRVASISFDAAFLFFNLLWYWTISYGIVRMARHSKPWDGF